MLTMTPAGQTAQAPERPQRRWWWLVVWLAVAALGAAVVAGLWAPSAEEPGLGAVDPLDAYTTTEVDPFEPSIMRDSSSFFYQASAVVIHRDGQKVGELTALELTPSALVDLDLDAFLKTATLADFHFQGRLAEDAIDMRFIGSTRVAAVFPLYPGVGGRFSAWMQDRNLMVLISALSDWTLADQFLQDYLATPPALPADEYTMTATDQPVTSTFENMPEGTFDRASVVAVNRAGQKVGELATLQLTPGSLGDMDLDAFLKDAIMSDTMFDGLDGEYIDMRIIGSTRVAAVNGWTLFAAWVQDGSLKVLTSTSPDRSLANHFLRDYLGNPPEISVTERPA
jgi:hypothetical protein